MQKITPLQKNDPVPEFTTYDSEENKFSNKNLLGQTYLIYFYPRDNTPGCSAQACGFRDHYSCFKNNGIKILGVSGDSPRSHKNFIKKHQLPFPLLLDENHQIARAFGVWGEKKFMGRVFEGIHRISFLINKLGKVKKTYLKVKAKQHPEDLVNEFKDGVGYAFSPQKNVDEA